MTTKTDITQERAAFEAWHERLYGRRPVRKGGGYAATAHTDRWTIWLACRAAVEADRQGRMPSDDELLQLASECCDSTDATGEEPKFTTDESILRFARALLSRYSSGQPAAEAVLCKILQVVQRYLPPDGLSIEDAMGQITALMDPWPLSGQPAASAEPRPDDYDYFVDWYDKEAPDESEVRSFDMARHAWLAGVRFADLFPAAASVAQEPVARDWPSIQSAIDEYLDGYKLIGEPGDHTPTEFEKFLLADAIAGLLDDEKFLGLFAAPVAVQAQTDHNEDAYVIERMGKLLAEIAVVVRGPEQPLHRHGYSDLPERVAALKAVAAQVQPTGYEEVGIFIWDGDEWRMAAAKYGEDPDVVTLYKRVNAQDEPQPSGNSGELPSAQDREDAAAWLDKLISLVVTYGDCRHFEVEATDKRDAADRSAQAFAKIMAHARAAKGE